MQEIDLKSWEEFQEKLKEFENKRQEQKTFSEFLYRGQGKKSWKLSTLERYSIDDLSMKEYHHLIFVVKPQVESFTGSRWNIFSYPDGFDDWISDYGGEFHMHFIPINLMKFMVIWLIFAIMVFRHLSLIGAVRHMLQLILPLKIFGNLVKMYQFMYILNPQVKLD